MNSIIERRGVRQFVKFGIVGASSTVIDWGIFYLINWFGINYLIAKILSFSIAVFNSFYWNRRWTFHSTEDNQLKEFTQFLVVAIIGLSLNALIMYVMVSGYHFRKIIGLIAATAIVMAWNFLANKYYTFKYSQGK